MNLKEAKEIFEQAIEANRNDNIDKAIELFSQIGKTSNEMKEIYAKAQLNLGNLLSDLKRFSEAEQAYKNVLRADRVESYASAQLNLGILIKQQERFSEAEQAYKNVLRADRADTYAKAQLNLGNLLVDLKRFSEAEQAYKNVLRADRVESYAKAQANLGFLYNKLGKSELCLKYLRKVKRKDSELSYAYAQYFLWLKTKNKIYLKHIMRTDDEKQYYNAQFKLGELEYSTEKPKLNSILDYWDNIPEYSESYTKIYYKKHLIRKIFNTQKSLSMSLLGIFKKVDSLLSSLIIKHENEDLIAHYTSPFVAKLLLAKDICGFSKNSNMRLNTIDLMNDPTEGVILNHYLNLSPDLISTNDQAFMACFTLHHDSLNQFRLYGKENQKEGSGLSLILSNQFFEQENIFSNIRFQNADNSVIAGREDDDLTDIRANSVVEDLKENIIQKLPLYRCVYIDPDSKLIEISHREEWTFCREEKSLKSHKWDTYAEEIKQLRDRVRKEFQNLENLILPLYQRISQDLKKYSNEAELLAEILLPLRFLVKHMAFKEEQECRVVYVTQWDDHFVQYDENLKRFYIDYGQDIVTDLKKIYLGPHALHEKNMFEYLCSHAKQNNRTEHEVKIKTSHNPLR